jgi:hypothetical protein
MAPIPTVAAPSLHPFSVITHHRFDHLHDEQPPPTGDTMYTVKFEEPSSDKTTESVTELLEKVKTWNDKPKIHLVYNF